MILEAGQKGNAMVELPPLSLYSMTKPQLEEIIPRLLNFACSTSPPSTPSPPTATFYKPEWWPIDVPWITPQREDQENLCKEFADGGPESTDKLRSVVKACYEYMGHKELLTNPNTNMDDSLACLKANTDVMEVDSSDDETDHEVVDVYVCFYCDHWFGGKEGKTKLEEHVLSHMNTDPCISAVPSGRSQFHVNTITQVPQPSFESKIQPVETKTKTFLPTPPKRRPEIPLWKRSDLPCNMGVSENEFLKSFGLITSKQAKTAASKSKPEMDIDCEIVAVEGLDSRPLTSPRTPRSLMSQLSRDGEGSSRKRLSFSLPDDASDGETTEASPSKNIQGALLNVPFSSLLGKRIKKHIKPDSSACTIKEPEEYCSTVKLRNEFLDKLRFRANDYPITYKKKRKHSVKFSHEYKFNSEQTLEFLKRVRTGLNKDSRRLKRQMNKCKVVVKRLSKEEINFWKEKKKHCGAEWIDDDISIVHIEPPTGPALMDRSRLYHANSNNNIRPIRPNPMQTPGHNPSILQTRSPYLMQHLATRQPQQCVSRSVPQFLVKKVEKQFNGHQSSKLVYVPISELPKLGPQKRIEPRWNPNQGTQHSQNVKTWGEHTIVADRRKLGPASSRRKQHFVNVRKELDSDSDVSIHSQSSEDEGGASGGKLPSSKHSSRDSGRNSNSLISPHGPKHMVMSATGEFVKTVGQKARKSFGGSTSLINAQQLKQFISQSHPNKLSDTPNLNQWTAMSNNERSSRVLGTAVSNRIVKPVYHSELAKRQNIVPCSIVSMAAKASPSVKPVPPPPPSSVIQPQPVLRVVDDVIYIDDDD